MKEICHRRQSFQYKYVELPKVKQLISRREQISTMDLSPASIIPGERYTLTFWCSVILLGCLLGNSIILLATIRYKAIKLDKTSVFLIKNIAVTDLAMGMFGVHPSLVSLLHGTWPYGAAACTIFYYIQNPISYVAAVLQVCALHLNKIYTILYPLRTVGRTKALAYRGLPTVAPQRINFPRFNRVPNQWNG